jgi:hypothetical protein
MENDEMKLVYTEYGYDFYIGNDKLGRLFYNVVPAGSPKPKSGYSNSNWICKINGVRNVFRLK